MKNVSKFVSYLFLIAGIGNICAVFFLFLKNIQEEKLFYLNLIVSCLVYTLIFFRAFDIFGSVDKVAGAGSGYGLKWTGLRLYFFLAMGLVVVSIIAKLGFNLCLIAHIVLLFVLLL